MKGKAVITRGTDEKVIVALSSKKFATSFLTEVLDECLGVYNPLARPAEFYVQEPDYTISIGEDGIEFRLTGSGRDTRTPAQFHKALKATHALIKSTIREVLTSGRIQLFCVIMLDGAIETAPGSGKYSNVIEADAEWIEPK